MVKDKIEASYKNVIGWLLVGLSILMLGKSFALCFSNDIWYDELFTVGMAKHSYSELVGFTARDVHPPLYYVIVKFVADFCKRIAPSVSIVMAAKTVSVLPYFILLVYSVTFVRRRCGIFVGGTFLFCTTAMPQLSAYTVEARMYSWALLFVTAALLHGYGALTSEAGRYRRLHGIAVTLYGLAAAYTQYFACVAVIAVYLYVLVVFWRCGRERIKEWLVWVAVSVLGYIPWLYALMGQIATVKGSYWILPLTWRSLGGCVKFLLKPSFANEAMNTVFAVVLFVVYVSIFAMFCRKVYYNRRLCGREEGKGSLTHAEDVAAGHFHLACAGLCSLCGLVFFGFVVSILVRPIFIYRYMLSAMGGFWLCFALCLDEGLCKPQNGSTAVSRWMPRLQLAIVAFIVVIGLRNYRAFMGEEEYKALQMQGAEQVLAAIAPDDIVIYNFDQVQAVTSYYLADTAGSYLWNGTPETLIQSIIRSYDTVEDIEQIQNFCKSGSAVWFIGSFNSRDDIVREWREAGLTVEEKGSCLLERYWFNLYSVSCG